MRLRVMRFSLAFLALIGARPVLADPINFTGFVDKDFNRADPNVQVTKVTDDPLRIGQAQFMTDRGWVSGWSIQDIRTSYDPKSDTLSVGVNTFTNKQGAKGIVGDSDGNGDPATADPLMTKAGGVEEPHLGGSKSVAIALAPDGPKGPSEAGTPVVIAGVPADKATQGPGTDGFNVAAYKGLDLGLPYNFGKTLTSNLGALAFDPSAAHPGFEFTIKNFSKIPGIDPFSGFWVSAYAGSPHDAVAGEVSLAATRIPAFAPEGIPEPATLLAWSLVVGGAALRVRRRAAA